MSEAEKEEKELGSIQIHKKVLAELAYNAVKEIKGANLYAKDFISNFGELLGLRKYAGITVNVDRNSQVVIEVKISVQFGMNVQNVARQTQDAIRKAIESTVDIDLKDVNVNIQGIERGKQ